MNESAFRLEPIGDGAPVDLGERVVVGRMATCDVPVQDKSVSREHARFTRTPEGYLVEDLNSTNGTLVNGRRITEPAVVSAGDRVTFGTVEFLIAGTAPAVDETPWQAEEMETEIYENEPVEADGSATSTHWVTPTEEETSGAPEGPGWPQEQAGLVPLQAQDEAGRLADEVVAITAHLSDLVEQLAAVARPGTAPVAQPPDELQTLRDLADSVPAAPMTAEELLEARDVLNGLVANPKDVDLLMRVRDIAPQLARLVEQYAQVEHVLDAIAKTLEGTSPG